MNKAIISKRFQANIIKKRIGLFMLTILGIVILGIIIVFFIFAKKSTGEIEKIYNENGSIMENSIAEKITVNINNLNFADK